MNDRDLLNELIVAAGLQVPAEVQELILQHLDWVLEQNLTLNLTSVTDPVDAIRLHSVDSLMVLPEVNDSPDGVMVDLGSGAGFPGVPLSLVTGRSTVLLDSVGKKSRAVGQFLADAGLNGFIEVRPSRAEELNPDSQARVAVVVARAVSSLPSLVELASPLLVEGGRLVAMKARVDDVEVSRGIDASNLCGMRPLGHREYLLPQGGELRSVFMYERAGDARITLPRRTGLAQRRPLA